MRRIPIAGACLFAALSVPVALGDDLSVLAAPPVVVRTSPEAGATGVDPGVAEIKVTFSKEMTDGSWSWSHYAPGNAPKIVGKPRYADDKKTCILPVKLEPGRCYALWLNNQRFHNFKDAEGRAAVPYLLVFETKE